MQPDSVYGDQLLGRGSSRDPLLGVCLTKTNLAISIFSLCILTKKVASNS